MPGAENYPFPGFFISSINLASSSGLKNNVRLIIVPDIDNLTIFNSFHKSTSQKQGSDINYVQYNKNQRDTNNPNTEDKDENLHGGQRRARLQRGLHDPHECEEGHEGTQRQGLHHEGVGKRRLGADGRNQAQGQQQNDVRELQTDESGVLKMANNCMVGITVTTFTEADGERLHDILTAAKMIADKKQEGVFIGCQNRYLFDGKFFRDRDTVEIFGWVKWGFSDEEVKTFLAWLMVQAGVKELRIDYDEPGCLLYGNYTYVANVLVKCCLPEINYPEDDGSDGFGITLESALKKYGVAVEVPMD